MVSAVIKRRLELRYTVLHILCDRVEIVDDQGPLNFDQALDDLVRINRIRFRDLPPAGRALFPSELRCEARQRNTKPPFELFLFLALALDRDVVRHF